ncbi:MAG: DUF2460 domain-containing protein [Alphaproteobacteria bacterium]
MAYLPLQFPRRIARGATGGHGHWSTTIVEAQSGRESGQQNWSRARGRWNVSQGIKNDLQAAQCRAHFYAARGRLHFWRFRDWTDYQLARADSRLVLTTAGWQTCKVYGPSGYEYVRHITRIVPDTMAVFDAGGSPVTFAVNVETGIVSAIATGVGYTVQCEFDVPCRYDTDEFEVQHVARRPGGRNLIEWADIPIIEVRDGLGD